MSSIALVPMPVTSTVFAVNVFIIIVNVVRFQLVFSLKKKRERTIGRLSFTFSAGPSADITRIINKAV